MSPDRLRSHVARARWTEARKMAGTKGSAEQRRQRILEALDREYSVEQYVEDLVALTKSKDPRVRARGLELLSKIQGDQAPQETTHTVRTRFGSFLTGVDGLPDKAQGGDGSGAAEGAASDDEAAD